MSWVARFPCHFVKKSGSTESRECTFSAVYFLHGFYILHSIGFVNRVFSLLFRVILRKRVVALKVDNVLLVLCTFCMESVPREGYVMSCLWLFIFYIA